jgi:hypothetical protein
MSDSIPLLLHVSFGVLGILFALVVFAESWFSPTPSHRKVFLSGCVLFLMLGALVLGGWWYVFHYPEGKALILSSENAWVHQIVMESKEHIMFLIVMLSLLLPVACRDEFRRHGTSRDSGRGITMAISGAIVLLGLIMEGMGGLISLAVRVALQEG